ncbi:hypothetical protein ACP4OV_029282 [Aristida adscensionis]
MSHMAAGVHRRRTLLLTVLGLGILMAAATATARDVPAADDGDIAGRHYHQAKHGVPSGQNPNGNKTPPPVRHVQHRQVPTGSNPRHNNAVKTVVDDASIQRQVHPGVFIQHKVPSGQDPDTNKTPPLPPPINKLN